MIRWEVQSPEATPVKFSEINPIDIFQYEPQTTASLYMKTKPVKVAIEEDNFKTTKIYNTLCLSQPYGDQRGELYYTPDDKDVFVHETTIKTRIAV